MKVLDLFCGRGGWSKPFLEDGDEVVGVDVLDLGYQGKLILADIRQINGHAFNGFDLIIGSPPCSLFSEGRIDKGDKRKQATNAENGLALIKEFQRVISEAKPTFWLMENVWGLSKFVEMKPIWKFYIGRRGRRLLWGNVPIPLSPEFRFPYRMLHSGRVSTRRKWIQRGIHQISSDRYAEIPYPIARFIADTVKHSLMVSVSASTSKSASSDNEGMA